MTRRRDHSAKMGRSNVGVMLPPLEFVMRSLRAPSARASTFYGRTWDERAVNWEPPRTCSGKPPKEVLQ